jgi:hypothetical protein
LMTTSQAFEYHVGHASASMSFAQALSAGALMTTTLCAD